jgi:GAF domain-containing protein
MGAPDMSVVMEKLRSFVMLPAYENQEKAREAQLAYLIAITFTIAPFLYGVYRLTAQVGDALALVLLPVLGVNFICLVTIVFIRRGFIRVGSSLLVGIVWLELAFLSTNLGGTHSVAYAGFIIVVVMAGLLMGWRAALLVVSATLVLGWRLVVAEENGALAFDTTTPAEVFFNYVAFFALSTGLVTAASRGFQTLLQRIQASERDLRVRNRELRQMRDSLEIRVAERTADLNRRSRYLEAAAQVAYAAGEILDADQLMEESVGLIQAAFGLYYVGFFIIDGTHEWAVLRAGTGEAGRRMLARQHRIRVGDGMIGWCVANGESRYAQQAEEDHVRLVAPELPRTRAEAALPLNARGRVLGALTVQSSEPDFFDDATVTVLQTMADLLAVALNNAELHEESEQAVTAVQRAYGDVASQAWEELLQSRGDWGYRYSAGVVRPVSGEWGAATRRAVELAQPVQDQSSAASSVAIPLRIGGRVVGAINYQRRAEEGSWEPEDIVLLTTLTDQLSQSLDSARLLQETQRQAAREQQINDIAVQLTNAVDIETMLRSAARELGRLPGVLEASVHINLPEPTTEDQPGQGSRAESGV